MAEQEAGPARGSDDGFLSGWQRVAVGICVALPVPVFAGTGLALPLPSVVYRLAVAAAERTEAVAVHLSGFKVVTAQEATGRVGTIRLTESERVAGPAADPGSTSARRTTSARPADTSHLAAAVTPRRKKRPRPSDDSANAVREAVPVLHAPATDVLEVPKPPEAPAASVEADDRSKGSDPKEKGGRSDDRADRVKAPQPDKGPEQGSDKGPGNQPDKGPDKAEGPTDSDAAPGPGPGEPQNDKPKDQEDPPAAGGDQDDAQTPGNGNGGGQGQGGGGSGGGGSNGGGSDKKGG